MDSSPPGPLPILQFQEVSYGPSEEPSSSPRCWREARAARRGSWGQRAWDHWEDGNFIALRENHRHLNELLLLLHRPGALGVSLSAGGAGGLQVYLSCRTGNVSQQGPHLSHFHISFTLPQLHGTVMAYIKHLVRVY